jgi:hypothetical protein
MFHSRNHRHASELGGPALSLMGLEELVSKRRDRARSGRTFEALGQGEEPAGSGDGAGDGGVQVAISSVYVP